MEKKSAISRYRERLDKTLSSAELTDLETLKTLVKNQILRYAHDEKEDFSEDLLEKRAREVSNFLDMLRSTSIDDHLVSKSSETSRGEWKLQHDNEEFRVMYREGPHGTLFHTLLVEGYVDGPLDVCLCISWESSLYKKWWPQSSFPSFKVNSSTCLQKVRIGEQISLVRMKVAWPMSAREALIHYFFFEYFQDDLIIILVNTISDVSNIDKAIHGFTNDGIPEAKDVVRIGLVGGFALQKVNDERSYFRTIANMDMKLEFVPPSFINFISRQLVGNGFRLYQKTVASVTKCDEDYSKALGDPLFSLIREALYTSDKSGDVLEVHELESEADILRKENLNGDKHDVMHDIRQKVHHANDQAAETPLQKEQDMKRKAFGEIKEECKKSTYSTNEFTDANAKRKIPIRPEVEDALRTLEKVISVARQHGFSARSGSSTFCDEEMVNSEGVVKNLIYAADVNLKAKVDVKARSKEFVLNLEKTSEKSRNSSEINDTRHEDLSSLAKEANYNKVVLGSSQPNVPKPMETNQVALSSYGNGTIKANGFYEKDLNEAKKSSNRKKHRLGCFSLSFG